MATNYSSWSIDKLKKEQAKIERAIEKKEGRDRKEAIAKIKALAKQTDYELSELIGIGGGKSAGKPTAAGKKRRGKKVAAKRVGKKAAGKKRGKVKPKYRNPKNKNETWTGRGRQPLWVRAHIENGGSMDSVTI